MFDNGYSSFHDISGSKTSSNRTLISKNSKSNPEKSRRGRHGELNPVLFYLLKLSTATGLTINLFFVLL